MFGAIKQPTGRFAIVECAPHYAKLYHIRGKLKSLGGYWNSNKGWWENIKEEDLPQIPASKCIKIRIAKYCHTEEHDAMRFEHEIDENDNIPVGCSYCDSFGIIGKVIKKYE